jgi:hypothetical protein
MTMSKVHESAHARNNYPAAELDLRAELTALRTRYDSGAVSPAVFTIIKRIETELAWLQHRGRP